MMVLHKKKGQSAIEFVISFLVLMGLFTTLFMFISSNYQDISRDAQYTQLKAIANKYYAEIKLASESPGGYERDFSTKRFTAENYTVSFHNGTAIAVRDVSEKEYIYFLDEDEFFTDTGCAGDNQIITSDSYGIHICCGSCDLDYGFFECSTNNISLLDSNWRSCNASYFVGQPQDYRVSCPSTTTSVAVKFKNTAFGTPIMSETLSAIGDLNLPHNIWFNGTTPLTFSLDTYYLEAICSDGVSDVYQNQTISVGGDTGLSTTWQTRVTVSDDDGFNQIIEDSNGDYVAVGYSCAFSGITCDVLLAKINSSGSILWNYTYAQTGNTKGVSLIQTADDGYVVLATLNEDSVTDKGMWLFKTDVTGMIVWEKLIETAGVQEYPLKVILGGDGNITVLSSLQISDPLNLSVSNYNLTGYPNWNVSFGSFGDTAQSIIATADGGYAVTGQTNYWLSPPKVALYKLDASGGRMWNKSYILTQGVFGIQSYGQDILELSDGSFVLFSILGTSNTDFSLLKTNSLGAPQWNYTYGGADLDGVFYGRGGSLVESPDGGFVLFDQTKSFGAGLTDMYAVKTDVTGVSVWNHTYGLDLDDFGQSAILDSDNQHYVFAGTVGSGGVGFADGWIVKVDLTGQS